MFLWNYLSLGESLHISKIKESNIIPKGFCFKKVLSNEVKKIIKRLNRKNLPLVYAFQLIFWLTP